MAVDVLFVQMRFGDVCGTSAFTRGVCSLLDERGLTYKGIEDADLAEVAAELDDGPRLVISCPRFKSATLFPLVHRYPDITFGYRTVSNPNMMNYQHELPLVFGWLDVMKSGMNAWLLPNNPDVMATLRPLDPDRVALFPNVYPFPFQQKRKIEKEHIRIAVAGRPCYSKNMAATAIALMGLASKYDIHVFVWCPLKKTPAACKHVGTFVMLDNRVTFMPWCRDFRNQLHALDIDVAICASTTESFGYVPADCLSVGIPVVGSKAVRFLPTDWQVADESDPRTIRHAVERILLDYPAEQARTQAAFRAIHANRAGACKTLDLLLS